jgi:hypothetical protein
MKLVRQLHLYLGILFAPLLIYFSVSGAWQMFRLNDLPKNAEPTALNSLLHELSNPHTHSALPGANPKTDRSVAFSALTSLMGLGITATALLGITLAVRYGRSRRLVWTCLVAGAALPGLLLLLK